MIWADILTMAVIFGAFFLAQRIFWASMVRSWDITDSGQNKWYSFVTSRRRLITWISFVLVAGLTSTLLFVF